MESKIFKLNSDTRVTFINQKRNQELVKKEEELKVKNEKLSSEEFKEKIDTCRRWVSLENLFSDGAFNLAEYPKNCILFDKDFDKKLSEEEKTKKIEEEYLKFKERLLNKNLKSFLSWRSPNGFHVLVPFKDFDKFDENLKKEIKTIYVREFDCDLAKVSDRGVVSLPDKPHFKNMVVYPVMEEIIDGEGVNEIPEKVLKVSKMLLEEKKDKNQVTSIKDESFNNFFINDPFFIYIRDNILPEGTNRDFLIFPSLAIASVSTGKTKEEIDAILKPIISKNFPGKSYAEFEGWLKKAFNKEIKDYNPRVINKYFRDQLKTENIYTETQIDDYNAKHEDIELSPEQWTIYNNDELSEAITKPKEELVKGWIGKGDICLIAGKSGGYKSTIALHLSLCIANNKQVFNKYDVKPCKVLYINEENHLQIIKDYYNRVKKGLEIEKCENFSIIHESGLKLDSGEARGQDSDLLKLSELVIKNNFEVVVIDVLRRVVRFDENDATATNEFFDRLKKFRKLCGYPTIILIHHFKKGTAKGQDIDIRDMLRGSSELTNNPDSVIVVDRKVGKECFLISHSKNRGALEQDKKLIFLHSGENKDAAIFTETGLGEASVNVKSKIDKCAEQILSIVEQTKQTVFERKELIEKLPAEEYSDTIVFRALKLLEEDGAVLKEGSGKIVKWVFNK